MFWFYVLPLGFLLTQYTITGFDSCAHISEETHGAADAAAKGVWRSIFYSAVFGWVLLLAITFAATERRRRQQGRAGGAYVAVLDPAARARHRLVQARARHLDGRPAVLRRRLPDQLLAHVLRVQPRRRDPRLADLEQGELDADPVQRGASSWPCAPRSSPSRRTGPASNGVPVAFYAVVSIAVIGLYIAYVIPIYLRWRMGDAFEAGPVDPRAQVQVDEPVRHRLGRDHHDHLHPADEPRRRAVERRVRLEARQLRAAGDRRP